MNKSLYNPAFNRDSCGFGLVAQMDDQPTHSIVETALRALARLTHRGAVAADGKSGDGCGVLLKLPEAFLLQVAAQADIRLHTGFTAGTVFLSQDKSLAKQARAQLESKLEEQGLNCAGWREVPVNPESCGEQAAETLPCIEQVFVNRPENMAQNDFDRHLFVARRYAELALKDNDPDFYVASLASQTLSYKGMVMPERLPEFYPDLRDSRLSSSVCLFHQRFSTNTEPAWRLAQPFRYLAHNGEINTIQGNRFWAEARAAKWQSPHLPDLQKLRPLVSKSGSDSCTLDNMLEIMLAGGLDILQAMRLLVPPAWQNVDHMDPEVRAFYEFWGMHMEAWDGPAGIVLCDGRYAACTLDRNGLRPARYSITHDRRLIIASEVGVVPMAPQDIVEHGRLKPGEMLAVDLEHGRLLRSAAIDELLKKRNPCKQWLKDNVDFIGSVFVDRETIAEPMSPGKLLEYEKMFMVTFEERDQVIRVLAETQKEAIGSMGDDAPLAVLSKRPRPLYDYFRQQFAQVTNPPIDPLREQIVMSLETQLGEERNIFTATPEHARRMVMGSPVLSETKFQKVLNIDPKYFNHVRIDLNYPAEDKLEDALERIVKQAADSVRDNTRVVILSDRGIKPGHLPVHALLATGAVHHHLVTVGLRCDCNIVVETATARDPHHFACLIGYGATAIYPYLAYECLHDMTRTGELGTDTLPRRKVIHQFGRSYRRGIKKGLYKIMSKMGISTIASYRGSQLFEIVGLHDDVVDRCFLGTTSRIQGAGFEQLQAEQNALADTAWDKRAPRDQGGVLKYIDGGEYHAFNPDVVHALQTAVRSDDYEQYKRFSELVNSREPMVLRDLLELKKTEAIALDKVESIEAITPRFDTAGMSLGALSPEAHEALAIAMNRMGGRSNSGEGGEDTARYNTERASKIKQIASGRFGVTPEYLMSAEVIQIKMAQGAKPGEGGQLPGHKVNEMIAELRYARPGLALISPPPHHDIYSIEDLAQLIFDLKQINPKVLVSVKLVSEPGVGTIAAGVAKAYADMITISGYDGGTGASPLTSVKYAGSPWELGLPETHQTLLANNLRNKVRLQGDGGLKTGLDVIKAAILGAESFGFGTAPMVAMGCTYLRVCHLNNCTTGVATQDPRLRRLFRGAPELAISYFRFVAQEVRELLAQLGVAKLQDLIGRTDLLRVLPGDTPRQQALDLSPILSNELANSGAQHCTAGDNPPWDKGELAERMVADTAKAIKNKTSETFNYEINNYNRSIGARLSGEIAVQHGNLGLEETPITINLTGYAGQSFGVFNAGGLHLHLEGAANDYVGKGMAGGWISIKPPRDAQFTAHEQAIIGNTCLYGATGGRLFAAGRAGERFAVRNSGALAVVEGIGDHGCEYMTGGVVVVLGEAGLNFGAGMTGGLSYVLDQDRNFVDRYNHELIDIHRLSFEQYENHVHYLHDLLKEHLRQTDSKWAEEILGDFRSYLGKFWMVTPKAEDIDELLATLSQAA